MFRIVAVIAAAWAAAVPAASAAVTPEAVARVDAHLEQQLDANGVPGAAVGIVDEHGTVHLRGFGKTGRGDDRVTPDTPFMIASATKSFTALATMQLVERGAVELDAPVTRYLPWFRVEPASATDRITVRMLLQQTSGLPTDAGGPALRYLRDVSIQETARELVGTELAGTPGTAWHYSNGNYVLLGALIETAAGQPYADYLRAHVLEPLGMRSTFLDLEAARDAGMASGHRYWFGLTRPHTSYTDGLRPTGGVISTAADLARYMRMLLGGGELDGVRVLSREGIAQLQQGAVEAQVGSWAQERTVAYGVGWFVGDAPFGPQAAVFHPGGSPDFGWMIVLLPEQRAGVVILLNATPEVEVPGASGAIDRISAGAASILMGSEPAGGWSMHRYYAVFDILAAVALGATGWALVRALRRRPEPAATRVRAVLRLARAALAMIAGALVLLVPTTGIGWSVLFLSVPDLALVLLLLGTLLLATGAVRLGRLAAPLVARRPAGATRVSPARS